MGLPAAGLCGVDDRPVSAVPARPGKYRPRGPGATPCGNGGQPVAQAASHGRTSATHRTCCCEVVHLGLSASDGSISYPQYCDLETPPFTIPQVPLCETPRLDHEDRKPVASGTVSRSAGPTACEHALWACWEPACVARSAFRLRHPAGVARIGNIKPTGGWLLCCTRCGLPARGAGCGVPAVLAGRAGRPAVSRVPGYE